MSLFSAKHREQLSLSKLTAWWQPQACTLFSCFKQGFNCIAHIKILIIVAKKNTFKTTETMKFFSCIFYHGPRFTSYQFDAVALLLLRSLRQRFWATWTGPIWKISPHHANHGGASWVTKLMQSMNKWPTALPKLRSATEICRTYCNILTVFKVCKWLKRNRLVFLVLIYMTNAYIALLLPFIMHYLDNTHTYLYTLMAIHKYLIWSNGRNVTWRLIKLTHANIVER